MKMDSAALYQQLGNLMATIPEFSGDGWQASPGLRIWSRSYIAALDGNTEDDASELELFDAH